MVDDKMVSVVIRTFKRPSAVETAIKSVLTQTYANLEVIVVDDGSPDETGEVLERLSAADDRIRVFRHEVNRGSDEAMRTGVAAVNGQFVGFLDDDDEYLPEKIAVQISHFQDDPSTDAVISGVRPEWCINGGNHWIEIEFAPNLLFNSGGILCKSETFNKLSIRWGNYEWRDFAFQLYNFRCKVVLTDDEIVRFNKSSDSMGAHSLRRYERSIKNAVRYHEGSKDRTENPVFQKYLANRYKSTANFCLKHGMAWQSIKYLAGAFRTEPRIGNLFPFT